MNTISEWFVTYASYSDTPEREIASQYAELVERLVKAAESTKGSAEQNSDGTWEISDAALREIEAALAAIQGERGDE